LRPAWEVKRGCNYGVESAKPLAYKSLTVLRHNQNPPAWLGAVLHRCSLTPTPPGISAYGQGKKKKLTQCAWRWWRLHAAKFNPKGNNFQCSRTFTPGVHSFTWNGKVRRWCRVRLGRSACRLRSSENPTHLQRYVISDRL
jgi:hypothetical protein